MKSIQFLYTEIGRGHPFYLDGIKYHLNKNKSNYSSTDVFKESDKISYWLWKLIYQLYISGSSENLIGRFYKFVRGSDNINESSFLISLLGRSLINKYKTDESPLLVAHPLLVKILSSKKNLFYQHGETVVPIRELPRGASQVFVPTKEVADKFISAGYESSQIITTGLSVEPQLVEIAERSFQNRKMRIAKEKILCGAFYSSGAEPWSHLKKIIETVGLVLEADSKAMVFCKKDGRLHKQLSLEFADSTNSRISKNLEIVTFTDRDQETELTARYFHRFDYFVAPSHERSNWALGLGLPLFILTPHYGSFSPLNRDKLLSEAVALELKNNRDIELFIQIISDRGKREILSGMSKNGWGNYAIDGFQKISEFIDKR